MALVGSAAAAVFVATHTGRTLPPDQVHLGGAGELLRLDGSDLRQVAEQITADIRFAPGYEGARRRALEAVFRPADNSEGTTTAARGDVAQFAACSWIDYWAARSAAGDDTAAGAATRALEKLLASGAVRGVDPSPSLQGYLGDQGDWVPTPFGALPAVVAAMRQENRVAVQDALLAGNLCAPEQVPHLASPGR
jgi:hypothetical protein